MQKRISFQIAKRARPVIPLFFCILTISDSLACKLHIMM